MTKEKLENNSEWDENILMCSKNNKKIDEFKKTKTKS